MDRKSVSTLAPQDWMRSEEIRAVMDALGQDGGDPNALLVGGCVRNALLGQQVDDIDVACKLPPEEAMQRLQSAGIKVVPTGIDHGTVTAVAGGKPFEITTLRKDVDTDGRHATVEFSTDWTEDARRRDFTMNTLLMDLEGRVFDPLGCGLDDLRARRVVFVGEPGQRIAEDHLRILRYFRFHALYADGPPDEQALAACRAASDKIAALSKERITQEFFKILSVEQPVGVLSLMFEHGILLEMFPPHPAASSFENAQQACASLPLEGEGRVGVDDFSCLSALCHFQQNYGLISVASRLLVLAGFAEKNLKTFNEFLLIPKVFQKDIQNLIQVLSLPDLKDDMAVKIAVYKYGRTASAHALMIELAQDRVTNTYAPKALEIIQNWDIPMFPLTGEDLIKEGFNPGPELGQELQRRENEWIDGGF